MASETFGDSETTRWFEVALARGKDINQVCILSYTYKTLFMSYC